MELCIKVGQVSLCVVAYVNPFQYLMTVQSKAATSGNLARITTVVRDDC
jgi:hypothetical protein